MTKLLAQHGAAKGKKIDVALQNGYIDGVVFAPREDTMVGICDYVESVDELDRNNSFLDAQLYYSTYDGKIFKYLTEDGDYPTMVSRRDWRKRDPIVMNYLNHHAERTAKISNYLITPGFYIQSLDWKFDYSMEIYDYCKENYSFEKYYMTLLVSFNFFHSKSDVDEMIEEMIDNNADYEGVYFTLCYDKTSEKNYDYVDSQNLANILYFVYSLKHAGIEVIIGYSFINTILFAMLDCDYVATGWFNTLRKFYSDRFEETAQMGRRKKRYVSLPLLSYISFEDLNNIRQVMDINTLLSGCRIDEYVLENQDAVSYVDLEQQYWEALSTFIYRLNACGSVKQRIEFMLNQIEQARNSYEEILSKLTNPIDYNRIKIVAKHLDSWKMGIETFKNRISIV